MQNSKIKGVPVLQVIRIQECANFNQAWSRAYNSRSEAHGINGTTISGISHFKSNPERKRHFVSDDHKYYFTFMTDFGFNLLCSAENVGITEGLFSRWWLDINDVGNGHLIELNEDYPRELCSVYSDKNSNNLFSRWKEQ